MDDKSRRKLLDPDLIEVYERAHSAAVRAQSRALSAARAQEPAPEIGECIPEYLELAVEFTGDPADVKAVGFLSGEGSRTAKGVHILLGRLDPTRLADLAAIPHVLNIRSLPDAVPLLNYSLGDIRAFALRTSNPELTGEGVVVGVIDSGFDWRHGSFTRPEVLPDNRVVQRSRFLAIWDQEPLIKADAEHPTPPGTPGDGGRGLVYSRAELDAALSGGPKLRTRDEKLGHGTHVAGIAAGDGSPNRCCGGGDVYVGVAPKADLVGVRLTALGGFDDALQFVLDQAKDPANPGAPPKPVVINVSLAFPVSGGHDGTHPLESIIDTKVGAAAGRVVVVAAGNYRADQRHIKAVVPKAGFKEIEFTINAKSETESDPAGRRLFDFWYLAGSQLHVTVTTPHGGTTGEVRHGSGLQDFLLDDVPPGAPPAPANLAGTAGDTQVKLSWDPSAGARAYDVYRDVGCAGAPALAGTVQVTTFTDTGLTNGTAYCYTVKARSTAPVPSGPSNQVRLTPAVPAPPAPLHLVARPGKASASLQWEAADRATSYEVYRDQGCAGTPVRIATQAGTAFTDTELTNDTAYCYSVKALNATGASPATPTARATPDAASSAPAAPTGLAPVAGDAQVALTWTAAANATAYEVQRDDGGGAFKPVATVTGTSYTDTGLKNGTAYAYVVKALNGFGSTASGQAGATPASLTPAAPGGLTLVGGDAQVTADWAAVAGATGYALDRATAPGGPYAQVRVTAGTRVTDTGLLNGTRYFYAVRATNAAGSGPRSPEGNAMPTSPSLMKVSVNATAGHPDNGDNNYLLALNKPATGKIFKGNWKLRFTNPSAVDDVELHGWVLAADAEGDTVRPPQFVGGTSDCTLSIPSTAKGAICVANYSGKTSALDCCPSGSISATSSQGPVRKNGNLNPKPDLAAPGEGITSANADHTILASESCACCPEWLLCLYQDLDGTSMASPHVAGAVALMLQADPTLTQAKVVEHLKKYIAPPAGGVADDWGAGLLDLPKAIAAVKGLPAPALALAGTAAALAAGAEAPAAEAPPTLQVLRQVVRSRARAAPDGELCLALVSRHFSEARRLVNTNPRVATMWHRGDGPRLLRRVVEGALDEAAPAPILDPEQRQYLQRMFDQLHRYGSPSLQASIDRHGPTVLRFLERPLAAQAAQAALAPQAVTRSPGDA